jgi:hypothetical protein
MDKIAKAVCYHRFIGVHRMKPTVRFVRTNAAGFDGVLAVITRLTPGA